MKIYLQPIKVPKGHLDAKQILRAVENTLDDMATNAKIDFDVTTRTWSNRPEFTIEKPEYLVRIVGTTSEVYGYVDWGTKPHPIVAKNPSGLLTFQTGYKAKTGIKVIGSKSGGKYGPIRRTPAVQHPGTDSREFSLEIAKKWAKLSTRIFQRAIDSQL